MKGKGHRGLFHSPAGHHDTKHGGKHTEHSVGHTAKAAKHHKGVGKVGGKGAKHHAGHKARGGAMTPLNPSSTATVKPLPFEKDTIPHEDTGGKGRGR